MVSKGMRGWRPTVAAAVAAAAVAPGAVLLDTASQRLQPPTVVSLALGTLTIAALTVRRAAPHQRPVFYVLCACACVSAWTLVAALEADGVLRGFSGRLVRAAFSSPRSAWAAAAAYVHGTLHLVAYLHMAYCASNGWLFRGAAIFHAAGLLSSCGVACMAAFLEEQQKPGPATLHWSAALNAAPALQAAHLLRTALDSPVSKKVYLPYRCPLRTAAIPLLVAAAFVCAARGLASMGSRLEALALYRERVEPLLTQRAPAPFATLQAQVALFYLAPACLVLAAAVAANPFRIWLRDFALAVAGIAFQMEACLLGAQWHPLTEPRHRLAPDCGGAARAVHACAHALALAGPAVCAYALCRVDTSVPWSRRMQSLSALPPLPRPLPSLHGSPRPAARAAAAAASAAAAGAQARHSRSGHAVAPTAAAAAAAAAAGRVSPGATQRRRPQGRKAGNNKTDRS